MGSASGTLPTTGTGRRATEPPRPPMAVRVVTPPMVPAVVATGTRAPPTRTSAAATMDGAATRRSTAAPGVTLRSAFAGNRWADILVRQLLVMARRVFLFGSCW